MQRRMVLLLMLSCLGCAPALAQQVVRLATTTTAVASGLLDRLLPVFEQAHDIPVLVSVSGSGAALRQGREGLADVLLVHSPQAEQQFMADGHGLERVSVMYNDFVIVGPPSDPAGLAGTDDAELALARIRDKLAPFLSRGDDSGTHRKELALWHNAGIDPYGQPWYHEMGMKIGDILRAASAHQAYTLADRGSWLALRAQLELRVLAEGDVRLRNRYSVIAINPARHPGINADGARQLVAWLRSAEAQSLIAGYLVDGEPLFHAQLDAPAQQATP